MPARWTQPAALLLFGLGTVFAAGGCSLALEFEQCASDDDCADFADGLVCTSDNLCIAAADAAQSCSNSACAEVDPNSVCGTRGTCVPITSPECTAVELPSTRGNMVLFGSIQPTTGDFSSAGLPQENAARLAVREFNSSGLLGDVRFGLIGCDSAGDTPQGVAAAQHLSEVLGVPAIVGPAFSGVFLEVASTVTVPGGVMTISGSATSEAITDIPDEGLAWRTIASDSFQSVAIADRVRDLRAASAGPGPFRVAAFGKEDAYGRGLLSAVGEALESELGEDNYFGVLYPPQTNEIGSTVAAALEANFTDAQVVLLLGTPEVEVVLRSYEDVLDAEGSPQTPLYILSDGGRVDEILALAASEPSLAERIEGTIPSLENGSIFTGFRQRFEAEFGDDPGSFASNAYDAAYLLYYAAYTLRAGGFPVDGTALADSMSRMVSGQSIEAGPANLSESLTTLTAGANIDYEGASGPLAFDLSTGEAPSNIDRYIIEVRAENDVRFANEGQYQVGGDGTGRWTGVED